MQSPTTGGAALDGWRERTRRGLRPELRPLFELAAAGARHVPEAFLHAGATSLPESLDHTWSRSARRWLADLGALAVLRPDLPRWVRELHRGDRQWAGLVRRRLREYHALAVAPYWPQLLAAAHTERTRRALAGVDGGLDGMLGTLHPAVSWDAPVLSVPCPFDLDLRLNGRGLLLVPTFFWPEPLALTDNAGPENPLVLRYPLAADLAGYRAVCAPTASAGPDGALVALLGTTRARTLQAVASPAGTAELARRTGTSPATASHHATILRAAGLLTTERTGPGVRHTLTPLGHALLHNQPVPVIPPPPPPCSVGGRTSETERR
ncbi:winged helix-turn-helix domain-containing protein [Kitasatospora sp. NPDC093806]|uniref:winged helix-turn-helix domain-containing protein n=1 Tax=Kitasatospora sp. NPDC093806 TaxID=3155075 RepID=UPI00343A72FD